MYWGNNDYAGNAAAISGRLNATAYHGSNSFEVTSRLLSRVFYMTSGTYTVSCYLRAPSSLSVYYGIMDATRLTDVPANNVTVTNGWQRFSSERAITTNGFYNVKLYHGSSTVFPLVDAIQVEPGSSATAYAPLCPVEMGLDTADPGNLLLSADTKQFRLRYWNDGAATTVRGVYQVFDYLNVLVGSGAISQSLAAGPTTVAVSLPARNGYLRITARLYNCTDSWDETSVAVLPFAASVDQDVNGFLGTHPNYSPYHMGRERRSGFTFARDLSPALAARWTIIEPARGNFVWNDAAMGGISTNGLVPMCNLFPGVSPVWPAWATNGDGTADFNAYSNFCYVTVARYSQAPYNVHYWETINEPYTFDGTMFPVLTNPVVQAMVITQSVAAIRLADPAAYIVMNQGPTWDGLGVQVANYHYDSVWTNLPAATQAEIDAISIHIYPQDTDPMVSEGDSKIGSFKRAASTFKGIKPLWNTETGIWNVGNYKSLNSLLQGNYDLFSAASSEAARNERQQRTQFAVDAQMYVALRSLGWGCGVYFNYWSKHFQDVMVDSSPTDPTVVEYTGTERPVGVALLMTKTFAGVGLGCITNTAATLMDLFVFTNALGTSVAAWNCDRTLKTLTVTNSQFAVYDVMGNQLATNQSTVIITRTPRYLVSGTLTTVQLSNTLRVATVATLADTNPPNIAIDVAPSGPWTNGMLNLVKWSAADENKVPYTTTDAAKTNIVYKWKLDAGSYTAYSASNHGWLPSLADGNHTLYVTALDSAGNSAEVDYPFDDPQPTVNTTTLNVGVIQAAP